MKRNGTEPLADLAARLRAQMPDESGIDLDAHAETIAAVVLEAKRRAAVERMRERDLRARRYSQ